MTMEDDKSSEMSAGYSFFPGKISAVEGNISSGRTMRVARVIEGIVRLASSTKEDDGDNRRSLSIWTVCGLYTSSYDLEYDPFLDLIERVVSDGPDVVVLCGLFVDGRQSLEMN